MHPALRHYYYYSSSSEALFVSAAGSGVGTEADPYGPAEFEAALPSIEAGKTVYFKKGDTFELAALTVPQNDITFSAYGSGADPVFLGSTDLGGATWTSETGGYYSTPLATAPKWVTINGEMARQGESAWIAFTSAPSSTTRGCTTATLNAFNTVQSLVGCKFRYKEFDFRLSYENSITAYNTGTGVLTATDAFVGGAVNMPMKLYGQKQFATLEGDWWYDDVNGELWIKTASTPAGTDIRVVTEDRAFTVDGKSGVTFSGIEFSEYYQEAIYANLSDSLTISGCTIHNIRTNGLLLKKNSDSVTITNNTIRDCGLTGINAGSLQNYSITSNTIHDIGRQDNIGWPIDTAWLKTGGAGIAFAWNEDLTGIDRTPNYGNIQYNTMYNLGYLGIHIMGYDNVMDSNVIYNYNLNWNDGGGIHTIHRSTRGDDTTGTIITNNIIYDSIGSVEGIGGSPVTRGEGIYIDNGTTDTTIEDNTVYNCTSYGIVANFDTQRTFIRNNNVRDCAIAQVIFRQSTNGTNSPIYPNNVGNIFTGNTLAAVNTTQFCVVVENWEGIADYDPFDTSGNSDNNHYIAPYRVAINGYATALDGAPATQSLADWITRYGLDSTSNAIANTRTYISEDVANEEVVLDVNATSSVEGITIGSDYLDSSGNAISGAQNIPAYSSLIYVSNISRAYLYDTFTAANGTAISGRSPNIGNVPTIVSGTHTINTNRMVSSVDGLVSWNVGFADYVYEISGQATNTSSVLRTDVRLQDNAGSAANRIILDFTGGNVRLREIIAGVTVNTYTAAFTLSTGVTYTRKIVLNGSSIKVYVNSTLYFDVTTTLLTGNHLGIFGQTTCYTETVTCYQI